jgi:hypothetical protein
MKRLVFAVSVAEPPRVAPTVFELWMSQEVMVAFVPAPERERPVSLPSRRHDDDPEAGSVPDSVRVSELPADAIPATPARVDLLTATFVSERTDHVPRTSREQATR